MTRLEKIAFVRELSTSIGDELVQVINEGKVPETWDGLELRELFADHAQNYRWRGMNRKRKREYKNTLLVNFV